MTKAETKEYLREWRRANPERWAEIQKRYQERHRERLRAYNRNYQRRRRAKKKDETEA